MFVKEVHLYPKQLNVLQNTNIFKNTAQTGLRPVLEGFCEDFGLSRAKRCRVDIVSGSLIN